MHRGRKARLDRLVQRIGQADRDAAERRDTLLARAAIGAAVRSILPRLGIDPSRAVMLRVAEEAASELAARGWGLPDAPPPPEGEPCWLDDDTSRLVERYRSGTLPDPDPAHASLAELFAWCIARTDGCGSTRDCELAVDFL